MICPGCLTSHVYHEPDHSLTMWHLLFSALLALAYRQSLKQCHQDLPKVLSVLPVPAEGARSAIRGCQSLLQSCRCPACQRYWCLGRWLQCPVSSHQKHLNQCQLNVLPVPWSLPMRAPSPSTGAQCWGHPCLKYSTISACWWSCWCQLCWLLLFPMSQKCFMMQLFYWSFFFLRLIHGS